MSFEVLKIWQELFIKIAQQLGTINTFKILISNNVFSKAFIGSKRNAHVK